MRIAVLDRKKCQPKKCGYLCIKACPGVRMGDETITEGSDGFPVFSEELCSGCGLCVKKCPLAAINIINLPAELEEPLHQYGVNAFRIYKIPTPAQAVVGLVGPNGIGKTTILNILAGKLVPNLNRGADWPVVLEKYRGKEVYQYLEKLSKGKTKLSYKPQNVSELAKYDSLCKDLINREALKKFELEKCANTKLSELSGGELQRTAIAAAVSRDADFYFFDEPSSYLDVRQRLRMAKIIREIKGTVFVVEHDLAVLDYLTDYIYILYGRPGVYGVVSGLKKSRAGINEFLDGFLKAENTRIRDYSIRFEVRPPAVEWRGEAATYSDFEKKYEKFKLRVEGAELQRGEVISILGPNAIGKTTFIKVLAGVEKPTAGDPHFKVMVSYKPQYLSSDFAGAVAELIESEKLDRETFEAELKNIVADLLVKNVSELSGGELQRLAIAIALGKKCDAVLLDEPSAFLDIEQRLNLARTIKRLTEKKEIITLVVDHDIVFHDAIANRMMIFEGEPGVHGVAKKPVSVREGMNVFLKSMDITYRRDPDTGRPRINKPGSQLDIKQRRKGEYYYA